MEKTKKRWATHPPAPYKLPLPPVIDDSMINCWDVVQLETVLSTWMNLESLNITYLNLISPLR
jgi:hypothetical protein